MASTVSAEAATSDRGATTAPTEDPQLRAREAREAFYATYDPMTGVRIAATLGGFFGLMVLLVLYKSKSKTERALEDPEFTAAAVAEAEAEEEERQMAAAAAVIEAAAAYRQFDNGRRGARRSLDTVIMPSPQARNAKRFSSIAGYSTLWEPPTRGRSPLPCCLDEDDSPPEETKYQYDDVYYNEYLDVPRRPSNITCSSSGSSYLERRDSSMAMGLPPAPCPKIRCAQSSRPQNDDCDALCRQPIDIKVIQPTPGGSPCGSDRALHHHHHHHHHLHHQLPAEPTASATAVATAPLPTLHPRLAPLASISSCNSSLGADYTDFDVCSYALSESLQWRADTDDEIDPFSTDSDATPDVEVMGAVAGGGQGMCCSSTVTTIRNVPVDETDF